MGTITQEAIEQGVTSREHSPIFCKTVDFIDGSPADGVSDESLGSFSGALSSIRVVFGTPTPNTLTVTVKDRDGITLGTGTVTGTGGLDLFATPIDERSFLDGLSLTLSGNTEAGAKAKIRIYWF